jgi:hypothetical protein
MAEFQRSHASQPHHRYETQESAAFFSLWRQFDTPLVTLYGMPVKKEDTDAAAEDICT